MSETTEVLNEHTSFGTFKPVGHVLLGIAPECDRDALVRALRDSGVGNDQLTAFAPRETVPEMQAMIDDAGLLAGFGHEITLMRRLLKLSCEGYRWLMVKVEDTDSAQAVAEIAKAQGVELGWHYRLLTVEDLIQPHLR
ncbi:MAG: hypothetical protein ABIR94_18145 [Rubrivivax sp.]